jgi:hypothetical protein
VASVRILNGTKQAETRIGMKDDKPPNDNATWRGAAHDLTNPSSFEESVLDELRRKSSRGNLPLDVRVGVVENNVRVRSKLLPLIQGNK